MAVPTRYREPVVERCGGQMIITADTHDSCLLLYTLPEWEEIERKVAALPSLNPAARRIQRRLIGNATDVDMDSNGRLLVPPALRELAGLSKKAVLIGQSNKFELWDEEQWNALQESSGSDAELDPALMPDDMRNFSL